MIARHVPFRGHRWLLLPGAILLLAAHGIAVHEGLSLPMTSAAVIGALALMVLIKGSALVLWRRLRR